jgi:prophage maintenance system killer protein
LLWVCCFPFAQGNKRTAFVSALVFLETNGFTLTSSNTELLGSRSRW